MPNGLSTTTSLADCDIPQSPGDGRAGNLSPRSHAKPAVDVRPFDPLVSLVQQEIRNGSSGVADDDRGTSHPSSNHPSSNHPSSNHPSSNHPSSNHPSSNHPDFTPSALEDNQALSVSKLS